MNVPDNVMTWKRIPYYRPFAKQTTDGFSSQGDNNAELLCFLCCQPEQVIEQTADLPVIFDARHSCDIPQILYQWSNLEYYL